MRKRGCLQILIVALLLLMSWNVAAASDRWVYSDESSYVIFYVDCESVIFNKQNQTMNFWVKKSGKKESNTYTVTNYKAYLKDKMCQTLDFITYKDGKVVFQKTVEDAKSPTMKALQADLDKPYGVPPGCPLERMINTACKIAGQKPIWGRAVHQWKQISADSSYTYLLCMDVFYFVDKDKISVFVKQKPRNPERWDFDDRYVCDLTNRTIVRENRRTEKAKVVVPETLEDKIFLAAKQLAAGNR